MLILEREGKTECPENPRSSGGINCKNIFVHETRHTILGLALISFYRGERHKRALLRAPALLSPTVLPYIFMCSSRCSLHLCSLLAPPVLPYKCSCAPLCAHVVSYVLPYMCWCSLCTHVLSCVLICSFQQCSLHATPVLP